MRRRLLCGSGADREAILLDGDTSVASVRLALLLAAGLLLAACAGQNSADADAGTAGVQDRAEETPGSDPRILLPGGVRLDTAARLRADTISQTETGATRRTLVVELLEHGPDSAQDAVTRAFVKAGYQAAEPKAGTEGKTGIRFAGAGLPSVWAVFRPDVPGTPVHPETRSVFSASWQVRPSPEKAN